jgi:hypothetical protein
MALVIKDRVKETTTSTGTGSITLAGASTGFQSFSSIGDGNTTYYTIASQTGNEWEVGIGTYTSSGTTLSRDIILESSNSGSAVNFSSGTKDVFVTYPAERASITYTGVKTSNYTAGPNEGVLTSTAGGAFTVTLPASPAANMQVTVADTATSWGTNNLTIARNGSTIAGLAEDLVCDLSDVSVNLIYTGTTWEVYAQVGVGSSGSFVTSDGSQTLTNKTISADTNTLSGIAASSFVLSNGSGNIDGSAAQKAIPSGVVVGTTDSQTLTNKTISGASNTLTVDGTNSVGFLKVPQSGSDKTTSYSLTTGDIGEFVGVGSGGSITIPNSTFSAGDIVSIFNNTTGNITITCSITTAYIAGTNTDKNTMTLATRGLATVLFISGTVCVVSGNVS